MASEWAHRSERGVVPLIRLVAWLSLKLGRKPVRALLPAISAYFLVANGRARRATAEYLAHLHGRKPKIAEIYRVFARFASVLHDRVFFLKGRFHLFTLELHGTDLFNADGALLMGAHLGSFEALRAAGHDHAHRRVSMAMYADNARKVNAVLAAIDPSLTRDVVALGRIDSMLELGERLDAGELVGVLADRTFGEEAAIDVDFLGHPAPFPTGPMRMAAALRRRVFFMVGLYRGGNRYEVHFEELADFSGTEIPRGERAQRVNEAIERYARRLEHYCRAAPDNWFNFHSFWRT